MNTENFHEPQRQSILGVVVIFVRKLYKFGKALWPVLIYWVFVGSANKFAFYAKIFIPVLLALGLVYSYFAYRRFLFHINVERGEFVLEEGVFSSKTFTIPFHKIQQVDLKRNLLQRIIGTYSLAIDTAGSQGDEITIHAISRQKGLALSEILVKAKSETQTQETKSPEEGEEAFRDREEDKKLWSYRLNAGILLKIGITQGYMRGFIWGLVFFQTIYSQAKNLFQSYIASVETYSKGFVQEFSENLGVMILMLFGLVVFVVILSMLITIVEVFLKYFNLKLEQTQTRLVVEMGLKTNKRFSFKPRRLQRLEISTNPIQKRLNLYATRFSLASSRDQLNKSKINVPGLTGEFLEKIKGFLYGGAVVRNLKTYLPVKRWLVRRYIWISLPLVAAWGIIFFGLELKIWAATLALSILYGALAVKYQQLLYRRLSLKINDRYLIKKHGLWLQKQDIVELYKLEGVTLKQPFYYKKQKLYNLTFHTAGGDVRMRALPDEFIKEINFILYKIESSQRAWM